MKSLLLTVALLLGQSPTAAPIPNGTIEGSVMQSGSSQPLEGVQVVADATGKLQATTDSTGHFAIKNVPPGRYFVFVQDQRYARLIAGREAIHGIGNVTVSQAVPV